MSIHFTLSNTKFILYLYVRVGEFCGDNDVQVRLLHDKVADEGCMFSYLESVLNVKKK
jgi:hypothetical protein